MIIIPGRDAQARSEQRSATFTGEVWADPILPGVDGTTIATIFFAPRARTFWHQHERGQILQVLAGNGFVCRQGDTPQFLRAGDVVWCPAGESHWHGATEESFMTHTAISLGTTQWAEEVAGADYAAASINEKRTP